MHMKVISNNCKEYLNEGIQLFEKKDYINAIEFFSAVLAIQEEPLARQYLARCYFRLNKYDSSYKHFKLLAYNNQQKNYANTMLATIKSFQEKYDESIDILTKLPPSINSTINLACIYLMKYNNTKELSSLKEAYKTIKSVQPKNVPEKFHWRIYFTLALCYQYFKKYSLARFFYEKALRATDDNITISKIINDYASLYIDMDDLEKAELLLNQSLNLVKNNDITDLKTNNEYRQLLEKKKKDYNKMKTLTLKNQLKKGIDLFESSNYLKAIGIFSMVLGHSENPLARQYLARCYYRLNEFEEAYKHFSTLMASKEHREYAISMLITITALQGNHNKAIKMIKKLPKTISNLLNLAVFYLLKHLEEGGDWLLVEAKKILLSFNLDKIPQKFHWKIFLTLAQVHQTEKEYNLANSKYKLALDAAKTNEAKGIILNEYGKYYIEINNLDKAEKTLIIALSFLENKNSMEEGYNAKYRGLLEKKRRNYNKAKTFLSLAAEKFQEKNLYKELAEVSHMLVELHNPSYEFYELAELYAEAIYYEKKREEVITNHAKILDFAFSNFAGSDTNSSS